MLKGSFSADLMQVSSVAVCSWWLYPCRILRTAFHSVALCLETALWQKQWNPTWNVSNCNQPGILVTVTSLFLFKPPAIPVTRSWVSQCKLQSKTWDKTHQAQWHFKRIYAFWLIGLLSYANVFMSLCLYSSTDNARELSTLRLKNKETKDFCEPLFHKNPDYTFLPIYKHFVSGASLLRLRRQPFLIRHHSLRESFNSFCLLWTNSKGKRLTSLASAVISKQVE